MNNGSVNTLGTPWSISDMDKVFATISTYKTIDCITNEIGSSAIVLSDRTGLQDREFPHGAWLAWGRPYDTITKWDEVSVWGIETFGLPGDRYITDININEMVWWFRDPQDRLLFLLRNGQCRCIELSCKT
jgi:hypothetical protein